MKQQIYVISRVTRRCPFSKKIIHPKTMLCVFNQYQYNYFVKQIIKILSLNLPFDLIEKIINLTNYNKLLNRTGLVEFTNWSNYNNNLKLCLTDTSDSDSDSNNDNSFSDDDY